MVFKTISYISRCLGPVFARVEAFKSCKPGTRKGFQLGKGACRALHTTSTLTHKVGCGQRSDLIAYFFSCERVSDRGYLHTNLFEATANERLATISQCMGF